MGGWGSGRQNGRPLADDSLKIDLELMLRRGWIRAGQASRGELHWSTNGRRHSTISYSVDLTDPAGSWLELRFRRGGEGGEDVVQRINLVCTRPNFGGLRWWMTCPYKHVRAGKLYLPPGGDRFASRKAWRLAYQSQRSAQRDRAFDALFRLQRKLGGREGWEEPIRRPKGMWRRTFERYEQRYWELDGICGAEMMGLVLKLGRR